MKLKITNKSGYTETIECVKFEVLGTTIKYSELETEKKQQVLELEYKKINDNYTAAIITYQDYDVLRRGEFNDYDLRIFSCDYSDYGYINKSIYIQGTNTKKDNRPMLIPNDELDEFKERIKKLNNKYGVIKYEE